MARQRINTNVICPPAETTETVATDVADKYVMCEAGGLARYMVEAVCDQDAIIDVEEAIDPIAGTWRRVINVDAAVLPFTLTGGVPFVMRGPMYGKAIRIAIKQDSAPGTATVRAFIQ